MLPEFRLFSLNQSYCLKLWPCLNLCFWFHQSDTGSAGDFYLVTDPESSGSPPKRAPPPVPISAQAPVSVPSAPPIYEPSPIESNASRSESFDSTQEKELTVDDIDDFDDAIDAEEIENYRARRTLNDASDLAVKLPPFSTGDCSLMFICWQSHYPTNHSW